MVKRFDKQIFVKHDTIALTLVTIRNLFASISSLISFYFKTAIVKHIILIYLQNLLIRNRQLHIISVFCFMKDGDAFIALVIFSGPSTYMLEIKYPYSVSRFYYWSNDTVLIPMFWESTISSGGLVAFNVTIKFYLNNGGYQ